MSVTRSEEPVRYEYGSEPDQFGDFFPSRTPEARGTTVFIHGGVWRAGRGWEAPDRAVDRLASLGWNVWKIQFRGVGAGGGWPQTGDDVAAAVEFLSTIADDKGFTLGPVVLVGHSSGGQLAVRALTAVGDRVVGAVSVEGVLNLARAEAEDLGAGGIPDFLGGTPEEVPGQYQSADPIQNIQANRRVRLVHARDDTGVPVSQSETYLKAAKLAGQDATLTLVTGDHLAPIDPDTTAWAAVEQAIEDLAREW
jgi:acetyl esterase/lipase